MLGRCSVGGGKRRAGVDRQPGQTTRRADRLQRGGHVVLGFEVDVDRMRARLHETRQIMVRPRDHQVHVQRQFDGLLHRRDHRRAEGNVVHEMAVHHVEVQPVRPGGLDAPGFLAELGEIARQQRRGDDGLFEE